MYTIIKSNIKKFSLLTIFIVAGQLLLIYAATINALVLNELIAMNLERFLKLSIYQMIVWCGIIFLDWVVKNYQVEVIQEFNLEIRNRVATDISNSTYQEFHSKPQLCTPNLKTIQNPCLSLDPGWFLFSPN
ncbi:hypothetical protein, partial [Streptococcus pneumoniae]|uniref:hypothetical protein n=1 Tax=Streptococcus pneumoniae TaxID=1313 RepID=UPI000AAE1F67